MPALENAFIALYPVEVHPLSKPCPTQAPPLNSLGISQPRVDNHRHRSTKSATPFLLVHCSLFSHELTLSAACTACILVLLPWRKGRIKMYYMNNKYIVYEWLLSNLCLQYLFIYTNTNCFLQKYHVQKNRKEAGVTTDLSVCF